MFLFCESVTFNFSKQIKFYLEICVEMSPPHHKQSTI